MIASAMIVKLEEHIPLEQGLRQEGGVIDGFHNAARRAYSSRTRIKTRNNLI